MLVGPQWAPNACIHVGRYADGSLLANSHILVENSYGTDGLTYHINKFVPTFVGSCYNHYNGGLNNKSAMLFCNFQNIVIDLTKHSKS